MFWRHERSVRSRTLPGVLAGALLVAASCSSSDDPGRVASGSSGTASGASDEAAPNDLDAVFDELRDDGFSGVVLVDDGGEVRVEGFGDADREEGVPNDGTTVFDIGSITKQFTGAAILRLQMDGQVSVEDPVSEYLPELTGEKGEITLHQLLTHTAGLPDALGSDEEPISRTEYLRLVAETPLLGPPGDEYAYSNVGYSVLAAVIETVTGGSYEEYLRTALFEPAGMRSTGYVLPDWDEQAVAVGYEGGEAVGRPYEANWDDDGPYWHLRGNGGLLSTAEDMHRWHEALVGDEILDQAAKEAFYGRHTTEGPGASSYYGYGWSIFPTPWDTWLITHDGGNEIFAADFLRFLDEDVTIFLASNDDDTVREDLGLDLAGAVFGEDLAPPSCGVADLDDFDELDVIDALPDTDAGAAAATLLGLIDGPVDETAARAFVEDHISEDLAPGATTDDLLGALGELRTELDGFSVDAIAQENPFTFHVRMNAPTPDGQVILSVRASEDEPQRIDCIDVGP
jgi:CubicO group peptidase (beta-lactamase class C family)